MISNFFSALLCRTFILGIFIAMASSLRADQASQVTQYGITWTFDKPYQVGQFVNGDYWVVGPVTIVSVSPAPGPAPTDETAASAKSRYGAAALVDNKEMRNGSMIILGPAKDAKNITGFDHQGYDSRALNYSAELSVAFPCPLPVNQTLVSTISSETYAADGKLATPSNMGEEGIFLCTKTMALALNTAAVLTCLKEAPPADAFRPPYVGTDKPIYQTKDIQWDLLPKLKPVASTPDWAKMERIFERPWLDHTYSWLNQYTLPGENGPNYGREFARMSSIATCMLLLDVPKEQKQKLMIEYIQLGIDLHGITQLGRQYFSDGGHWQGRKWPILFASLVLNKVELRAFPQVGFDTPVYGRTKLSTSEGVPAPTTLFQEDMDTYYGKGGEGQTVLWQIVDHTHPRDPYEQKPQAEFTAEDKFVDGYRGNNSGSWIGVALAAQYMKAKSAWNHDAFFDYVDRWMSPDEKCDVPKWLPKGCTRSVDLFVEEMWNTYRASAPEQAGGKDNVKWVWDSNHQSGHFVINPKGSE